MMIHGSSSDSSNNVLFIQTDNEKFAFAYAMEKAVLRALDSSVKVSVCIYEGMDGFIQRMGDLRWLRADNHFTEQELKRINDAIKFKFVNRQDFEEGNFVLEELVQFHVFPSKALPSFADFVKFLILCSDSSNERTQTVIIDSVQSYNSQVPIGKKLIESMFPPRSVMTMTAHPASRQFELQNVFDRAIFETIKMEMNSDRMRFYGLPPFQS